ncbi:MAG: protease HtpX [Bdellovibrionales bacterium]|nr:protease HtpX [Bdellovibrionales bacterium]
MGCAFVSLALSKILSKWVFGIKIIDPETTDPVGKQLIEMVLELSNKLGLSKMPEVGVYESEEVNSFSTGPSKDNSLVALSTGLVRRMSKDQVEGVLAHEIAHVANGDMVSLTLIQGVVNVMVVIPSKSIAKAFSSPFKKDSTRNIINYSLFMSLQIVLGLLGILVVNYFSRDREFHADAGGAKLVGREKMLSALVALSKSRELIDPNHTSWASLKISSETKKYLKLLSTHPPMDERLHKLEATIAGS